jgi:hypothetical protein
MSVIDNVPLSEQIAEVQRELAFRKRVYPRLVRQFKMTSGESARHMLHMQAVLLTLETVRDMRLTIDRAAS